VESAIADLHAARQSRAEGALRGRWARSIALNLRMRYLIKGLIPADAFLQIFGEPNCGKSAVALDMAGHLSIDRQYRGRRVRGVPVAYFALEGRQSIENRIVAWCQHHDVDRNDVRVFIVSGVLDLRSRTSTAEAIQMLADAAAETGEAFGLIVLDTQARATPGAAENSAEDMSAMIANCDRMRQLTGASVALIHHSGKDTTKGARGHSSQLGAVDVALEIADHQIIVRKARDTAAGESIPFDLVPVDIGTDEDGDAVTAVVAVEAGARSTKVAQAPKVTGHAKTALQAFNDLAIEGATKCSPGTSTMPVGALYIDMDVWRVRFMRLLGAPVDPDDRQEASRRRNAWSDATAKLSELDVIKKDGPTAWRPSK